MIDPHVIALEEQVSHQQSMIDDLSDMVRKQGVALDRLEQRVGQLMERAAVSEAEASNTVVFADQTPPHY